MKIIKVHRLYTPPLSKAALILQEALVCRSDRVLAWATQMLATGEARLAVVGVLRAALILDRREGGLGVRVVGLRALLQTDAMFGTSTL